MNKFLACILLSATVISFIASNVYGQYPEDLKYHKDQSVKFIHRYLNADTVDYNLYLLLNYLQTNKEIKDFSFDATKQSPRYNDNIVPFNFFNSIIGAPNLFATDSLFKTYASTKEIEHLMLWGANSKLLTLDENAKTFLSVNSNDSANIRTLCHIAISIRWAKGKMSGSDKKFIERFKKKYIKILICQLDKMKEVNDDFTEGLVGLICLGAKHKIKPVWITMLKKAQNTDGGWCWGGKDELQSHPHTTILAYWIVTDLMQKTK